MQKMITAAALALALTALPAFAQTTAPTAAPATTPPPPAATMPAAKIPSAVPGRAPTAPVAVQAAAKLDPAVEAKFKAIDKDNNGALEGTELSTLKDTLAKIDTNKDGKVSRDEFAAATKGGVIK